MTFCYTAYMKDWCTKIYGKIKKICQKICQKISLSADGSLRWWTRLFIIALAICGAIKAFKLGIVIGLPLLSKLLPGDLSTNEILQSTFLFSLSALVYGLGLWIIRTHDTKKQFTDTFKQQSETLLSDATTLLCKDKPSSLSTALGLIELLRLKNTLFIDEKRIDSITSSGLNLEFNEYLKNADLRTADLRGAKLGAAHLRSAKLNGAKLGGASLDGTDLCGANLCGANLKDALGVKSTNRTLIGALYNDKTLFPKMFNPEQAEMRKHG